MVANNSSVLQWLLHGRFVQQQKQEHLERKFYIREAAFWIHSTWFNWQCKEPKNCNWSDINYEKRGEWGMHSSEPCRNTSKQKLCQGAIRNFLDKNVVCKEHCWSGKAAAWRTSEIIRIGQAQVSRLYLGTQSIKLYGGRVICHVCRSVRWNPFLNKWMLLLLSFTKRKKKLIK